MRSVNIFNRHFLHYHYLNRDIKKAIEEYSYRDGRTLDAGCGKSPYEELFCYHNGITVNRYVGIDRKFGDDIRDMKIKDATFDNVFCSQVLEHVDDYQKAISEIWRVLKPKGILILTVPFTWQLHGEPHDYRRFTPYGIEYMLKEFTVIKSIPNGGKWACLGQISINCLLTSNMLIRWIVKILLPFLNIFFFILDKIDYSTTLSSNYITGASKNT